jgi:hypothetical protein
MSVTIVGMHSQKIFFGNPIDNLEVMDFPIGFNNRKKTNNFF